MKRTVYFLIIILTISCKNNDSDKNFDRITKEEHHNKKERPFNTHNPLKEIEHGFKQPQANDLFKLSIEFYQSRNYHKAIETLNSALSIEKNPIIYNQLGVFNVNIKKYDEAIKYYKLGQEIDSTYYFNFINESRVYIMLEKYESAKTVLNKLIKDSNNDYFKSYANYYLAVTYFFDGKQCVKAIEHLTKSEKIKNDSDLKDTYIEIEKEIKNYCS